MTTKKDLDIDGADYEAMHELFGKLMTILSASYDRIVAYEELNSGKELETEDGRDTAMFYEKLRAIELKALTKLFSEGRQILRDLSAMRAQDVMVKQLLQTNSRRFVETAGAPLLQQMATLLHAANQGQNIAPLLQDLRDRGLEAIFKDAALASLTMTLKDAKISS